jgi:uncharacterized protein (TIGR03435 family)
VLTLCGSPTAQSSAQTVGTPGGLPTFEVASVKRNKTIDAPRGGLLQPGRFVQTGVTLRTLIGMAYSKPGVQLVDMAGGPDWMDTDRFDVEGKGPFTLADYLPTADGNAPPVYLMLRSLLAERFKVVVHTESRELSAYALVVNGKLGPKMTRSDVDCDAVLNAMAQSARPPAPPPGTRPRCSVGTGRGRIVGEDLSMARFAGVLSGSVNRTVKDQTGLKGNFNLTLDWSPDELSQNNAAPGISIFTALQEQLGLKLESTRAPVDVLVIDHAEQPTPD